MLWPNWDGMNERAATEYRGKLADEGFSVPAMQAIVYGRPDLQVFGNVEARGDLCSHIERVADIAAALRAIAWGGRFLVIGFTAGIPRLPLNLTLLKGCQIVGVFLGAMVSREPATRDEIVRDLLEFTSSGKLNPYVSKRYSLDEGPQALRDMMDRKAVGKVVVAP